VHAELPAVQASSLLNVIACHCLRRTAQVTFKQGEPVHGSLMIQLAANIAASSIFATE
jgi:hypothetical protein